MSEKTNLRQADTKVEVVGIVSENTLEESVRDGKKVISGDITVQTGDINFVTFRVYVNEKKNDGTDNGCYAGIETVTNGQIRPRSYVGKDKQVHVGVSYQTMFFNRYDGDPEKFEPRAWFEVEMAIASITPELYTSGENKGEETGRAIVKGWVPTYSGIEPMTLVAPAEDGIAVKIGKPRFEKKTIYKNEMIITNASDAYGEDSETPTPEPYDIGAISQAITDREVRLEEEKAKAKQPETAASAATTKARPKLPNF